MSDNCIFCKIIQGKIPSKKVFENDDVYAFLDIFPTSEGHTVVVPKQHYYNLLDFPDELIGSFFKHVKQIAFLLKSKLNADGFNIVQNNFPAAGQVVDHFHYHIIPRKEGDNALKIKQKATQATNEELEALLEKLK
jgi:histidine triad (HIT) family protein